MAREFAQIKLAIWSDDDWRDLSPEARYLYLTLLTSPTLTHCGTADWRPARMSAFNGQTRRVIENAGTEMVRSLHILIDHETEEVLIRSFIRNDGLMKQPKMAVAMANAHGGVASATLRGVIVHEARRLRNDFPDLHGWGSDRALELLKMRSVDPSTYPLGKGSIKGKRTPKPKLVKGSPTPSPTPATTDSRLTPSTDVELSTANAVAVYGAAPFEAFWDAYGKKVGRGAAEKAWSKATKNAKAADLIAAAAKHADWHSRANTEARFIPHATTWLNEKRWTDERPEPTTNKADGDIDWDAAMQRAKARDERNAG